MSVNTHIDGIQGVADPARLDALRATRLMDSAGEEAFDRLTRLASKILGVPVALVSLVDNERQFFKSQIGLPDPWSTTRTTPLSHSFCRHVVDTSLPLVVDDAREHALVRNNPVVAELGVIAYAGVPLKTVEGHVLGAFCAIDGKPREWSDDNVATLRELADLTMTEIELRAAVRIAQDQSRSAQRSERFARNVVDALSTEIAILDDMGSILEVNRAWAAFARENSSDELKVGVGSNYLEVCERAGCRDSSAAAFADGIRSVIQGDVALYEKEYPCHSETERRWFVARVTRFTGEGPTRIVIAHENITKRKLAELEQDRLTQHIQMLLESTGECIYGVDTDGNCTFMNRAAAICLGLDPVDILGKNVHALTHHSRTDGSPYPAIECPIYEAFRTGKGTKISSEVFWKQDGTPFPVEYSSHPIQGPGRIRGAVVVFSDISARIETEQKLNLLSLVASNTDNAVIITDRNRVIEWVNDAFTRITGYLPEEAIGLRPGRLLQGPATDKEAVERIRDQLLAKKSFTEEILNYRKDGHPYWLELSITPVLDARGEVEKYIAIESDISERKKEEERRNEQLRLTALMAEVGTAITQSDELLDMLRRCAEALVLHLNGAFARIWTLNHETKMLDLQASAGMYTHLDGPHSRIPVGQFKIGKIAEDRKPHLTNAVVGDPLIADQEWAKHEGMISFAGYPLIVGDEVMGVAGMFARQKLSGTTLQAMASVADGIALGIQRISAAEDLQKSTEAAEQANRAKSQFLANMSHELRTPLNAVIMYSELLMEEAEDLGVANFLPDLEKIRAAGRHLLGLINNVLDLSKIEAGKMDLFLESFNVADIVEEVASTIGPLVEKKSNRLLVTYPSDPGAMRSDMTKVRQVLINLLGNASKFTENGEIRLIVQPETSEGTQWITFRIEDTGIGMTPDQLGGLFQIFTQADASTTRKYGGTGLGLAITRRICEMLGGSIDVVSIAGEGSVFTVRLPASIERIAIEPELVAQQIADPRPGDAGTVLVIDDDPGVRDMMSRFLHKENYRALTAAGGKEGLKLARQLRPDIITLDVMMPGNDGWSVLQDLKADPELSAIPVIILTVVDDRNLGFLLGATEYVNKPIDRARLGALLEKYRPKSNSCRVLIVDDNEDTRKFLRETLENERWTVVEADDGLEALARLGEELPDIILLDLLMPQMNGFEFAAELRRNPAWRKIPVVVITAKDLSREDRTRLQGTAQHVLQKGTYRSDDLLRELRDLIKQQH